MALSLEDKKAIVAEVSTIAASALSAVAAEYRGITVGDMTELRAKARDEGVYLKVAKNSLVKRAVEGTEFECMQDELKEAHEPGAVFMTHRRTKTVLRKIKDGDGNYMWQQGEIAGAPSTLFGTPVVTNSNFAVEAANALILAYGNIAKTYLILDRIGTRVLRDPYTNKPFVHFYATKRVGSMLMDSEALKVLECAV